MCSIFKYFCTVGRNFDYERSYNEKLIIVERNKFGNNHKIIGMCTGFIEDYPLLYDGMNEQGLVCGGLAFEGTAMYYPDKKRKHNIPSYDFPLKILGDFSSVKDVKRFLKNVNITNKSFSDELPPSDLHWFIADCKESIIVEQTEDGLNFYNGDVMTNNPVYPLQKRDYEVFKDLIGDEEYVSNPNNTRGKETMGLDGDYTSDGRFERLSWLKEKLEKSDNGFNNISQAFHLLSSVEQIYGATPVDDKYEYTIYSVVYDMSQKKVYLKNYDALTISRQELEI